MLAGQCSKKLILVITEHRAESGRNSTLQPLTIWRPRRRPVIAVKFNITRRDLHTGTSGQDLQATAIDACDSIVKTESHVEVHA